MLASCSSGGGGGTQQQLQQQLSHSHSAVPWTIREQDDYSLEYEMFTEAVAKVCGVAGGGA